MTGLTGIWLVRMSDGVRAITLNEDEAREAGAHGWQIWDLGEMENEITRLQREVAELQDRILDMQVHEAGMSA